MTFDREAFLGSTWEDRAVEVAFPQMSAFFADGERPMFWARGISFDELNRARAEPQRTGVRDEMQEALAAGDGAGVVAGVMADLGLPSQGACDDTIIAYAVVEAGLQVPEGLTRPAIAKLARVAPVEFRVLFTGIMEATGLGNVLVGSPSSG